MATYAVGDVHGCLETLNRLLDRVEFDFRRDRLWLVGDLVNGGPDSLEVLRWVREREEGVVTVLGNHDLHMLAVAAGGASMSERDNFDEVLEAPDADELLEWLRHRPLVHRRGEWLMVHAGLLPSWTTEEAVSLAGELEERLASEEAGGFLEVMHGNEPRRWRPELGGDDRLRLIVNALTRLRTVERDGAIDFDFASGLDELPDELTPWFEAEDRASSGTRIVCGHWSAIGYHRAGAVHVLDSGCAWGGELTALRLEDETLFQVDSELPAVFG